MKIESAPFVIETGIFQQTIRRILHESRHNIGQILCGGSALFFKHSKHSIPLESIGECVKVVHQIATFEIVGSINAHTYTLHRIIGGTMLHRLEKLFTQLGGQPVCICVRRNVVDERIGEHIVGVVVNEKDLHPSIEANVVEVEMQMQQLVGRVD